MAGLSECDMAVEDIPMILTWFEDATDAARALGLDIELPDVGETDKAYWANLDRQAWRDALKGKVDMDPDEIDACDPDWVLLKNIDGGRKKGGIEIWFDIEEGVRFRFRVGNAATVARIIHEAAARGGLKLSETWPGNVVASPTRCPINVSSAEELKAALEKAMEKAGYFWEHLWWVMRVDPDAASIPGGSGNGPAADGPGGR
jgi:hypothetical protein